MYDPLRGFASSYVTVTAADDADVPRPLKGLNVAAAGYVKITTVGTDNAPSWTGSIYVTQGDNGTAPIKRVFATGATSPAATIVAGIL